MNWKETIFFGTALGNAKWNFFVPHSSCFLIPQGYSLSVSATDKVGCEPVWGKAHLRKYSCSLTMRAKTCLLNNKFLSLLLKNLINTSKKIFRKDRKLFKKCTNIIESSEIKLCLDNKWLDFWHNHLKLQQCNICMRLFLLVAVCKKLRKSEFLPKIILRIKLQKLIARKSHE